MGTDIGLEPLNPTAQFIDRAIVHPVIPGQTDHPGCHGNTQINFSSTLLPMAWASYQALRAGSAWHPATIALINLMLMSVPCRPIADIGILHYRDIGNIGMGLCHGARHIARRGPRSISLRPCLSENFATRLPRLHR